MKPGHYILIIIVIVAFFVIRYYNKQQKIKQAAANLTNGGAIPPKGNFVSNFIESVVPNNTNNSGPIKTNGYEQGDKLYAKTNTVTAYKSASSSSSQVDFTKVFSKDELVGTYLSTVVVASFPYIKISATNPVRVIYIPAINIYSK